VRRATRRTDWTARGVELSDILLMFETGEETYDYTQISIINIIGV